MQVFQSRLRHALPRGLPLLSVGFNGSRKPSVRVFVVGDHITSFEFCRNQRKRTGVCLTIVVKGDDGVLNFEDGFAFMLDLQLLDDVGKRSELKDFIIFITLRLWFWVSHFLLVGPPGVDVDLCTCHLVDPFGVGPSLCDHIPQSHRLAGLQGKTGFKAIEFGSLRRGVVRKSYPSARSRRVRDVRVQQAAFCRA